MNRIDILRAWFGTPLATRFPASQEACAQRVLDLVNTAPAAVSGMVGIEPRVAVAGAVPDQDLCDAMLDTHLSASGTSEMPPEKAARLASAGWRTGTADEYMATIPTATPKPDALPSWPTRAFLADQLYDNWSDEHLEIGLRKSESVADSILAIFEPFRAARREVTREQIVEVLRAYDEHAQEYWKGDASHHDLATAILRLVNGEQR